ncbi:MAG: bifunctional diaminohydroxyphosphoribosylaminopyrimidine deaminase/5-amino-6-(5-phosphoribosylamino)uracil reductase RibD [Ardenticatenales bacterium]|nr:bifunctional diaminohydroxyphosphoribosylaminopyrimidine deaminase/5-amino-6-(5-phosphoribosylamino)uracil reductase RibD [Ardenticatenales bacterium]
MRGPRPASPADAAFMARALALAERGIGRTSPNPSVGAVLVQGDAVVGEGRTAPAGGPHAEAAALAAAGAAAAGATAYVTLEPCAHHGRTPPCADALIAAGVSRVVYALRDPNPSVDGAGAARLLAAGLDVVEGVGADAARTLYAPFARWITTGRPFVTAKWAMTLDGRIASRTGDSRWISGPPARAEAHRLRDRVDAVVVGSGTVVRDDPALTVRLDRADTRDGDAGRADSDRDARQPLRVVLDSTGLVPLWSRVFDVTEAPTLVATVAMPAGRAAELRERGVEVVAVAGDAEGRVDIAALLDILGRRGALHVLVEGGAAVHGSFVAARAVDAVWAVVAPVIVGGREAPGPVGGHGVARMADAVRLTNIAFAPLNDDIVVTGTPTWPTNDASSLPPMDDDTSASAHRAPATMSPSAR